MPPLREGVYRYLFYGWLFRDADSGSALERAMALRHNQAQARWLPLYLLRWLVIGALLWTVEQVSESIPLSTLSVPLALALIFVVIHLLLTTIFWAFLRGGRFRAGGD
ncbi:MAG: hypothetical protein H7Z19_16965 [Chitinophagaceae bacterium]|nr:hypothetical protein [Rubrivivax sp.]